MVVVLRDDDTGNEIIWFIRRGKPYFYLRDKETKRFIKRLREIEVRVYQVIDYPIRVAKKANPLYVDAVGMTRITAEEWEYIEVIEERLKEATFYKVARYFGYRCADTLLEEAGIEYGSIFKSMTLHREGRYRWVIMWKHHPKERGKREEGEDWL